MTYLKPSEYLQTLSEEALRAEWDKNPKQGFRRWINRELARRGLVPMVPDHQKVTRNRGLKLAQDDSSTLSPRDVQFIQRYVALGFDSIKALSEVYPEVAGSAISRTLSRIFGKPGAKEMIKSIQDEAATQAATDASYILRQFVDVYNDAKGANDRPSALRALENLARLAGMFVERVESKVTHAHVGDSKDPIAVQNDIERLADVAGFKVIKGGQS